MSDGEYDLTLPVVHVCPGAGRKEREWRYAPSRQVWVESRPPHLVFLAMGVDLHPGHVCGGCGVKTLPVTVPWVTELALEGIPTQEALRAAQRLGGEGPATVSKWRVDFQYALAARIGRQSPWNCTLDDVTMLHLLGLIPARWRVSDGYAEGLELTAQGWERVFFPPLDWPKVDLQALIREFRGLEPAEAARTQER